MAPTLQDGDHVLVWRGARRVRAGWIVAAWHPQASGLLLVKRVGGAPGDIVYGAALGPGDFWLSSDNLLVAPDDSRTFGAVAIDAIAGRIVLRYRPLTRSRSSGTASASESNT